MFKDRASLEKQIGKKLKKLGSIDSIRAKDMSLGYEACEYLAEVIRDQCSAPMTLVDLERCFADEDDLEEERPMAIETLLDAVDEKGALQLNFAINMISDTIATRISESFERIPMLQVLDLSNAMLRNETATIAQGLQNSEVRLKKVFFTNNEMYSEGAEALA